MAAIDGPPMPYMVPQNLNGGNAMWGSKFINCACAILGCYLIVWFQHSSCVLSLGVVHNGRRTRSCFGGERVHEAHGE